MCESAGCGGGVGNHYVSTCVEARVVEGGFGNQWTKINLYLPSLMMKVSNHLYVFAILLLCLSFYAYWLYFIYVWHVHVSPKTYKWFGTFIIKDERYTFTFWTRDYSWRHSLAIQDSGTRGLCGYHDYPVKWVCSVQSHESYNLTQLISPSHVLLPRNLSGLSSGTVFFSLFFLRACCYL
jgi:hypothetical protein